MVDRLAERVRKTYGDNASAFFERVRTLNMTDRELSAVPSLFIPGWGEDYDASVFKIAIAGKETLCWSNDYGDSLRCDLDAYENGRYDVLASCRRFREEGPAEWQNVFWQYPATVLARLFDTTRDEILSKGSPLLRSIAWFNGHAVETYESKGLTADISTGRLALIQIAADESKLSDFETFVKVFHPHVILYFYRNKSEVPSRNFPDDIEYVQSWCDGVVDEYRTDGQTILLHCPHTSYLTRGNMKQSELADVIYDILKTRNVRTALCDQGERCDFHRMSAAEWTAWVEFVRNESEKFPDSDDMTLSRHLIATVAKELIKKRATMNAQTLVLILNEVDKFRRDNWWYSPERRGPCASVRGAWNEYSRAGRQAEAGWIAEAFTKLNGEYAWE